jgi:long-chain fatty acid transport protein
MWHGLNLDLLLGADQVVNLITNHRATGALVPVLGGVTGLQGAHFSLTRNQPLASGVDAWGFSGRFGLVYKATPETTVGASYTLKSQMDDMEGNATLSAVVTGGATAVALNGKIKIKDFQMPAHADLGLSHQINEQWLVAADVSRVFWRDVMKDIKVGFVDNGGLGDLNILLPQDYKDQSILSLGAAYKASDSLTLRGGVRLATQSLRGSTLFAVIPATPTKHLSLGMTYAFSKQAKLDFGYSHAFKETMSNNSLPNSAVASPIEVTHEQNNATVNFRYAF